MTDRPPREPSRLRPYGEAVAASNEASARPSSGAGEGRSEGLPDEPPHEGIDNSTERSDEKLSESPSESGPNNSERNADDPESFSDNGENPENHDIMGSCPFGHWDDDEDCPCECPRCWPSVSQRPQYLLLLWETGAFDTAGRIGFPPPRPLPGRRLRNPTHSFLAQGKATAIPPEIMSEISSYNGEFDKKELHKNFPNDETSHNNFTFALGLRPCTEQIPWNTRIERWQYPCPNDRRRVGDPPYEGRIERCQRPRYICLDPDQEDDEGPKPYTLNQRPYVCEQHIQDSKDFYEEDKLIKAHLVGTCRKHITEFTRKHPCGYNSCTCRNLLDTWQCRRCYRKSVRKIQGHFRLRVLKPDRGGGGDQEMVRRPDYHLEWKDVRKMLAKDHPCHHSCGRKRLLNNSLVVDCRACGGIIIRPTARRTRNANLTEEELSKLDYYTNSVGDRGTMVVTDPSTIPMPPYDDLSVSSATKSSCNTGAASGYSFKQKEDWPDTPPVYNSNDEVAQPDRVGGASRGRGRGGRRGRRGRRRGAGTGRGKAIEQYKSLFGEPVASTGGETAQDMRGRGQVRMTTRGPRRGRGGAAGLAAAALPSMIMTRSRTRNAPH